MASPFQNPTPNTVSYDGSFVSVEEFKVFHSIDRKLFTRLVIGLGRDPAETMQVMAFLLWLERTTSDLQLVSRLLQLPDTILHHVTDEAATILKVVDNDDFPCIHEDVNSSEIPLLQTLMFKCDNITLRFFHGRRLGVIRGVTHLMNETCVKAFDDIIQKVVESRQQQSFSLFQVSPSSSPLLGNVPFRAPAGGFNIPPSAGAFSPGSSNIPSVPMAYSGSIDPRTYIEATAPQPPYQSQVEKEIMSAEMGDLLDEIHMTCTGGGNDQRTAGSEVPPDERTIFLTFSKGYPISDAEVREFFTRRNGDVIDGIHMQEVSSDEQILYARMVVKTQALIDVVLGGKDVKAKFSINGKHVWGRKYVKKQTGGLAGASSTGSPPGGQH